MLRFKWLSLPAFFVIRSASSYPCTLLCADGSGPESIPDYTVQFIGSGQYSFTCEYMVTAVSLAIRDEMDELCGEFRRFGTLCGCETPENACKICGLTEEEIDPSRRHDVLIPPKDQKDFFCYTCECIQAYAHSYRDDSDECRAFQSQYADFCGCPEDDLTSTTTAEDPSNNSTTMTPPIPTLSNNPDGDVPDAWVGVFGANSPEDLFRIEMVTQLVAFLSFIGAIGIICDTMCSKIRRNQLYNQIVSTMAIVDIVYVFTTGLRSIPAPAGHVDHVSFEASKGNWATCKAQGMLIHWSAMTSLGFNCSLSTYFYIAIVYRMRKVLLDRYRRLIFLLPIAVGSVLSLMAYPIVLNTGGARGCYLLPPMKKLVILVEMKGIETSWAYFSLVYILPAILGIMYTTVALAMVVRHIRKVNTKGSRWAFERSPSSAASPRRRSITATMKTLERQVALQSALYLLSLYSTWVVVSFLFLNLNDIVFRHYPFWVFVSGLLTAQGFFNSVIYFRPRLCASIAKVISDCRDRRSGRNVVSSIHWASVLASSDPAVVAVEGDDEGDGTHPSEEVFSEKPPDDNAVDRSSGDSHELDTQQALDLNNVESRMEETKETE